MTKSLKGRPDVFSKLDADDAFIALLIAAMDASGHVSAEEAARAHTIARAPAAAESVTSIA